MAELSTQRLHELAELLVDAQKDDWASEERWEELLKTACDSNASHVREVCDFVRKCKRTNVELKIELVLDEQAATIPVGTKIDRFTVCKEIDSGGMGTVYEALFEAPDMEPKRVALKVIKSGFGAEKLARRLRAERNLLSRLDHRNIVKIHDAGYTASGHPYLTMELIEGGLPIHRYCSAHVLSLADRIIVFQKLCSVVQFVHEHNIIHRDLKPANILVTKEGEPKLLDFGLATFIDPVKDAPSFLNSDVTPRQRGTKGRMSPQQEQGHSPSISDDIFALGTVLRDLLGTEPSRDRDKVSAIMERCLCALPAERFPTAASISDALETAPKSFYSRVLRSGTPRRLIGVTAAVILTVGGYFSFITLRAQSKVGDAISPMEQEGRRARQSIRQEQFLQSAAGSGFASPLEEYTGLKNASFEKQEQHALALVAQGNRQTQLRLAQVYIYCRSSVLSSRKAIQEKRTKTVAVNSDYWSEEAQQDRVFDNLLLADCTYEKSLKAVDWLRSLARTGNSRLAVYLAEILYSGVGDLQKEPQEALVWAKKAAEAEDPDGLYLLGVIYAQGLALPMNEEIAVDYFEQAAQRGSLGGQYYLARALADGSSSKHPKNLFQAYVWALIAVQTKQGLFVGMDDPLNLSKDTRDKAISLRDELASNFLKPTRDKAQAMATAWKPSAPTLLPPRN